MAKPDQPTPGAGAGPAAMPGLVPVITQDAASGEVLMLAWADRAALAKTLASGAACYYSRSRRQLWPKGATSGNTQRVAGARVDCDRDAVLLQVHPAGPACHTGNRSCFFTPLTEDSLGDLAYQDCETPFLAELAAVIAQRDRERPAGSYVASLLASEGGLRALQKVGEEAVEFVIAGAAGSDHGRAVAEAADLLFHLLVALRSQRIELDEVLTELRLRHNPKSEAQHGLETSPPGKT